MKIAIISGASKPLVNFRLDFILSLKDLGYEVHTIAPDCKSFVEETLISKGIYYHIVLFDRTGLNIIRDICSFFTMRKKLLEIRPDIVLSFTVKPVIYGSLAAKSIGVKKIYSLISGLGNIGSLDLNLNQKILKALIFLMYKLAFRVNKRVIFQNNDDKETLIRSQIISREKTSRVMGSGINLEQFSFSLPLCDPIRFIFIGRFLRKKGVIEYVEACKIIKKKHPKVECVLLGQVDTTLGAIKEKDIKNWAASGYITYIPKQRDIRPFLTASSVFVLPSYYGEGIPRTALEAMATGRALIMSDSTGCRDTVWENENGFLVQVKNIPAIVSAMEKFIHDTSLIIKMGRKSRKFAEEYFDVKKVNKNLLEIIFESSSH